MSLSISERIKQTESYSKLEPIQKSIYGKSSVRKEIEHYYKMASLIGVDRMLELEKPRGFYYDVVIELIKQDQENSNQ